ncbi:MAG: TIGR01777 family protein [Gemmatimonadetes bacterium 13_1_40CM_2_70_7]|nr:MAG: TIGR01777 family protein [Gemmatimonadetes bacterium 13_1_40CM_2_70_7]PYO38723.1 MAG: TIGR01777 family protein [Gemmatimonadota bacterium]
MRIVLSGASGLIGSALVPFLAARGHEVVRLVRRPPAAREARWDPAAREIDRAALERADAVVHLSGENILGRWTAAKRAAIRSSRVDTTRFLAETIAGLARRPATLVAASAIGYYGDRGDEPVTEDTPPGTGFMAELCRDWEAASDPAREARVRVVRARIGLVLTPSGGSLERLLPFFRWGLGGPIGRGRQWWSWIAVDDLLRLFAFALERDSLGGPVNVTSPEPVRNAEFARVLGRVLHRPAVLPVPPVALRVLYGEAADEVLLTGQRVLPARALQAGFGFTFAALEPALRHLLRSGA